MKRALLIALFFLCAYPCYGQEATGQKRFSTDILVGFTTLTSSDYKVEWEISDPVNEKVRTSESGYIDPAMVSGLAFTYYPANTFIHAGITLEGFYQHHTGKIKGGYGDNPVDQADYELDMVLDFYQLNALGTILFTSKPFQPYLQLGVGAVRSDIEIEGSTQTIYGGSAIAVWGTRYRFLDWMGAGVQLRLQDMFGQDFSYKIDNANALDVQGQYIHLSFLLQTTFYF